VFYEWTLKRESEYDEGLVYVLTIQTELYTTRIDVHVLLKWTFAQNIKKHTQENLMFPKSYCLQKAELVIQHHLYTQTWQRKQPFMNKNKER